MLICLDLYALGSMPCFPIFCASFCSMLMLGLHAHMLVWCCWAMPCLDLWCCWAMPFEPERKWFSKITQIYNLARKLLWLRSKRSRWWRNAFISLLSCLKRNIPCQPSWACWILFLFNPIKDYPPHWSGLDGYKDLMLGDFQYLSPLNESLIEKKN